MSLVGGASVAGVLMWVFYPKLRKKIVGSELANSQVSNIAELADEFERRTQKHIESSGLLTHKIVELQTKVLEVEKDKSIRDHTIQKLEMRCTKSELAIKALLEHCECNDAPEVAEVRKLYEADSTTT